MAKLITAREFTELSGDRQLHYIDDLLEQHAEDAGFPSHHLKVIYSPSLPDEATVGLYEFETIFIYTSPIIKEPARPLYILAHEIGHWRNMLIDFKGDSVAYWQASPVDKEPKAWLYGWEYAKKWSVRDYYLRGLEDDIEALEEGRVQRIWLAYRDELLRELQAVREKLSRD